MPFAFAHAQVDGAAIEQAIADPRGWYEKTLTSIHRPTLSEVVSVLEACEACRELVVGRGGAGSAGTSVEFISSLAREHGPGMIVQLEAFYPGGVYATLGRDAFGIADVLEAFYYSMHVEGRVRRLGASGPTFTALGRDPDLALNFLISNGLDLDLAESGERPFAIIDRTSYSWNSQSTQLARAIFTNEAVRHRRLRLAKWVGVVSTESGFAGTGRPEEVERFKAHVTDVSSWQHGQAVPPILQSSAMLALSDQFTVWHESFVGPIIELPDGRLSGTPGVEYPLDNRRDTLLVFWNLFLEVSSEQFQSAVFSRASQMGFDLRSRLLAEATGKAGRYRHRLDRLAKIVEVDLLSVLGEKSQGGEVADRVREKIQALATKRRQRWTQLSQAKNMHRASEQAHQFNLWRRALQRHRNESSVNTLMGLLLREISYDLPVIHSAGTDFERLHLGAKGKKLYFSANAKQLIDVMRWWKESYPVGGEEVADMIRVVEQAARLGLITPRDDRRLVLYALSSVPRIDAETLSALKDAINGSPLVRRLLIDRAEVFLTSNRYNEGRNREVYMSLVEAGALPQLSCAALLEARND